MQHLILVEFFDGDYVLFMLASWISTVHADRSLELGSDRREVLTLTCHRNEIRLNLCIAEEYFSVRVWSVITVCFYFP